MDQIVDYRTVLLHNIWSAAGFIGTFCNVQCVSQNWPLKKLTIGLFRYISYNQKLLTNSLICNLQSKAPDTNRIPRGRFAGGERTRSEER